MVFLTVKCSLVCALRSVVLILCLMSTCFYYCYWIGNFIELNWKRSCCKLNGRSEGCPACWCAGLVDCWVLSTTLPLKLWPSFLHLSLNISSFQTVLKTIFSHTFIQYSSYIPGIYTIVNWYTIWWLDLSTHSLSTLILSCITIVGSLISSSVNVQDLGVTIIDPPLLTKIHISNVR